jgi:hypothetical protein
MRCLMSDSAACDPYAHSKGLLVACVFNATEKYRGRLIPGLAFRFRRAIVAAKALVAQLDRASDFESEGREFESLRARQHLGLQIKGFWIYLRFVLRCISSHFQ